MECSGKAGFASAADNLRNKAQNIDGRQAPPDIAYGLPLCEVEVGPLNLA